MTPNLRSVRLFSSSTGAAAYESFDDNIFYTPVRKAQFQNGVTTIYHQDPKSIRYVPWEVKETTIKNVLGVAGMVIIDYLFAPGATFYTLGAASFGLNWMYRVYGYMGNAITHIDLHEDGKTVTVTFKTGGTANIKIKDIMKR